MTEPSSPSPVRVTRKRLHCIQDRGRALKPRGGDGVIVPPAVRQALVTAMAGKAVRPVGVSSAARSAVQLRWTTDIVAARKRGPSVPRSPGVFRRGQAPATSSESRQGNPTMPGTASDSRSQTRHYPGRNDITIAPVIRKANRYPSNTRRLDGRTVSSPPPLPSRIVLGILGPRAHWTPDPQQEQAIEFSFRTTLHRRSEMQSTVNLFSCPLERRGTQLPHAADMLQQLQIVRPAAGRCRYLYARRPPTRHSSVMRTGKPRSHLAMWWCTERNGPFPSWDRREVGSDERGEVERGVAVSASADSTFQQSRSPGLARSHCVLVTRPSPPLPVAAPFPMRRYGAPISAVLSHRRRKDGRRAS